MPRQTLTGKMHEDVCHVESKSERHGEVYYTARVTGKGTKTFSAAYAAKHKLLMLHVNLYEVEQRNQLAREQANMVNDQKASVEAEAAVAADDGSPAQSGAQPQLTESQGDSLRDPPNATAPAATLAAATQAVERAKVLAAASQHTEASAAPVPRLMQDDGALGGGVVSVVRTAAAAVDAGLDGIRVTAFSSPDEVARLFSGSLASDVIKKNLFDLPALMPHGPATLKEAGFNALDVTSIELLQSLYRDPAFQGISPNDFRKLRREQLMKPSIPSSSAVAAASAPGLDEKHADRMTEAEARAAAAKVIDEAYTTAALVLQRGGMRVSPDAVKEAGLRVDRGEVASRLLPAVAPAAPKKRVYKKKAKAPEAAPPAKTTTATKKRKVVAVEEAAAESEPDTTTDDDESSSASASTATADETEEEKMEVRLDGPLEDASLGTKAALVAGLEGFRVFRTEAGVVAGKSARLGNIFYEGMDPNHYEVYAIAKLNKRVNGAIEYHYELSEMPPRYRRGYLEDIAIAKYQLASVCLKWKEHPNRFAEGDRMRVSVVPVGIRRAEETVSWTAFGPDTPTDDTADRAALKKLEEDDQDDIYNGMALSGFCYFDDASLKSLGILLDLIEAKLVPVHEKIAAADRAEKRKRSRTTRRAITAKAKATKAAKAAKRARLAAAADHRPASKEDAIVIGDEEPDARPSVGGKSLPEPAAPAAPVAVPVAEDESTLIEDESQ